MQSAEIELKFPVQEASRLEAMLPGLGFYLETPRTFEHNTLYDTPDQLGYQAAFVYEKFRTEWGYALARGSSHLVIDETPIGTWAELEGPTDWIDAMLIALKVEPSTRITSSYGKLFMDWKEQTGSLANDLTFAAIAPARVAV